MSAAATSSAASVRGQDARTLSSQQVCHLACAGELGYLYRVPLQLLINQLRDEVDSLQMQLIKANNHSREVSEQLSHYKSELASTATNLQQAQHQHASLVESTRRMKER